jgi:hypothetical protein
MLVWSMGLNILRGMAAGTGWLFRELLLVWWWFR